MNAWDWYTIVVPLIHMNLFKNLIVAKGDFTYKTSSMLKIRPSKIIHTFNIWAS